MTIQRYVKHVLGPIYVVLTLLGHWGARGGGGVSQGIGTQPADAVFHPGQLKKSKFWRLMFFLHLDHVK